MRRARGRGLGDRAAQRARNSASVARALELGGAHRELGTRARVGAACERGVEVIACEDRAQARREHDQVRVAGRCGRVGARGGLAEGGGAKAGGAEGRHEDSGGGPGAVTLRSVLLRGAAAIQPTTAVLHSMTPCRPPTMGAMSRYLIARDSSA